MHYITFCFFLSFLCFKLSGNTNKDATERKRPNIVLIIADDLGISDLPVYGNSFNEAPNLDRMAQEGMLFNNAYAAPVCSPTRASIQSGQCPARVGIFDFIPGHWRPFEEVTVPQNEARHLPDRITTIGESLQKAGYTTGYFGKWHLGNNAQHLPSSRGYSHSHVYAGGGFYSPRFIPEYKNQNKERLCQTLTRMGVDFIRQNQNDPFFLTISHYDVHVQLDADKEIIDRYLQKDKSPEYPCNAVYAAMIEHMDKSVGEIMKTIDDLGLKNNTLFIFCSDNGGVDNRFDNIPLLGGKSANVYPEKHPLRYIATSNVPYRSGKGTLYEGGIRIPFIVRWPGKADAGSQSEVLVSAVDFYPSFLELAGAEKPQNQILDGISILPALSENTFNSNRELFTHYPVYHHDQPMSALRKGDWKIIENLVSGECSLYNLKYDVNEMTDLQFSYPKKLAELKSLLKDWQIKTNAKMPVVNPRFNADRRYEWGKIPLPTNE